MMRNTLALLLLPVVLAGCVTAESSFEQAKQADSVSAYRSFLAGYPQHPLAVQAKARIDDLDFQTAIKTNSVASYEGYLKEHRDSTHAQEARQRLAVAKEEAFNRQAIASAGAAEYGQLVAMEEEAKRLGYSTAIKSLRTQLDRFDVTKVAAGGYEIAVTTSDQKRLESAKAVVRVRCAVTTSRADSLSSLLDRNIMSNATRQGASDADTNRIDSFMQLTSGSQSARGTSAGETLLYLYPEAEDDEVVFRDGALELRDRINGTKTIRRRDNRSMSVQYESGGNSEGTTVATLKTLRRSKPEDGCFSILERAGADGKATYCALIMILQLPSKEQLTTVRGQGAVWIVDTKGNSVVSVDVASPVVQALISGTAKLPKDKWIALAPGVSARNGEIRFEETRVVLSEGAELALKRH